MGRQGVELGLTCNRQGALVAGPQPHHSSFPQAQTGCHGVHPVDYCGLFGDWAEQRGSKLRLLRRTVLIVGDINAAMFAHQPQPSVALRPHLPQSHAYRAGQGNNLPKWIKNPLGWIGIFFGRLEYFSIVVQLVGRTSPLLIYSNDVLLSLIPRISTLHANHSHCS